MGSFERGEHGHTQHVRRGLSGVEPTSEATERNRVEALLVYRPRTSVVLASSGLAFTLAILAGAGIAVAVGALTTGDQTVATIALLEVVLVVPFAVLLCVSRGSASRSARRRSAP